MSHGVVHLQTLGGVDLRGPDGLEARPVLAQPKRLALLLYLAAALPRGFHRKDTLLALFWPESSDGRARRALNKAVYYLRHALDPSVLLSRGDEEVAVAEERLWCDAVAFERALDAGQPEEALALYRGDFAPGFFVSHAPDFERWMDTERHRLRERAVEAALGLAEREEASGRLELAERWARHASGLSPYDERAARRHVSLLDRGGDRAGALRAYEEFARRLRDDLEVEPSPETQALVATVRSRWEPEPVAISPRADLRRLENPPTAVVEPAGRAWSRLSVPRAALVGAAAAVAGMGVWMFTQWSSPSVTSVDPNVVAILPFRVTGGDSSMLAFRNGMVELLSPLFTGGGVPRAVSPGLVLQEAGTGDLELAQARGLARRLGAGLVIQGSVVALTDRYFVLSAALQDAASGTTRALASHRGPAERLAALIDGLAAELLVRASGESGRRLPSVLSTSLPAIQEYIAGQAAYRAGHHPAADSHFNRALDIDSTFVQAAMGRANSGLWTDTEGEDRAIRLAWSAKERLGAADRAVLAGLAGPRYPSYSTDREVLAARERGVDSARDRPEAWFILGDILHHGGWALGADAVETRASAALHRALQLDTTLAEALLHLIERGTTTGGDTVGLRRLVSAYLAVPRTDSTHIRWRTAIALGDGAALRQVRTGLDQAPTHSLQLIQTAAQYGGMGIEDAERAIAVWERRAGSQRERLRVLMLRRALALNRGRPSEALTALNAAGTLSSDPRVLLRARVLDGLYWEGDSGAAEQASRELQRIADTPPARDAADRLVQLQDRCVLEQWRVWRGDAEAADAAISRLATADPATYPNWGPSYLGTCVALLRATRAVAERRPDAALLVDRLDSLAQQDVALIEASLVAARLWSVLDDPERALAAARRRMRYWTPTFLSSYLREEGRLAALTGDRAGAIRAYRHYLTLRYDPEPALRPEVDAVRVELARLVGDR